MGDLERGSGDPAGDPAGDSGDDRSGDPAQRLRVSDAERHQVAEILREAAGEGRLDLGELDERLEATYAAKVYADLVPIVVDLPVDLTSRGIVLPRAAEPARPAYSQPAGVAGPATRYDTSLAIMSGQDRRGVWEIGPVHTAFALMGGVVLDLREARFASREVVINASTVMGGVDIWVNPHTRVSVEGIGIMGGFEESRPKAEAEIDEASPLVRVRGFALMGGVSVQRKPMPGEGKRRLLGRG